MLETEHGEFELIKNYPRRVHPRRLQQTLSRRLQRLSPTSSATMPQASLRLKGFTKSGKTNGVRMIPGLSDGIVRAQLPVLHPEKPAFQSQYETRFLKEAHPHDLRRDHRRKSNSLSSTSSVPTSSATAGTSSFVRFEDGIVYIEMTGACVGCGGFECTLARTRRGHPPRARARASSASSISEKGTPMIRDQGIHEGTLLPQPPQASRGVEDRRHHPARLRSAVRNTSPIADDGGLRRKPSIACFRNAKSTTRS
ncbi:MAG: NifU family protein [Bacillus subtilis]|nr:NifU family protein [Bacillus subtilis]